jgi:hypothetical protein
MGLIEEVQAKLRRTAKREDADRNAEPPPASKHEISAKSRV